MSRLMIRPPGPLPGDRRTGGMFCWAAMLRASGLALTRPPSPARRRGGGRRGRRRGRLAAAERPRAGAAAPAAERRAAAAGGRGCGAAGAGAGAAGAAAAARPRRPWPASAEMSSSGSAITPISDPTGALPPAGTRILRRTPAPRASISMLALSVSISASTSPTLTGSPFVLVPLDDGALLHRGGELRQHDLGDGHRAIPSAVEDLLDGLRPPSRAGAGTPSRASWRRAWARRRRSRG